MHNTSTAGHFATDIMFDKIRSRYYWPQMYENIREYVRSCDACQRRGKPHGKVELNPIEVHSPFFQIGIDFVGPLPITQKGNRYIIVAMDYLTKWPEAKAVSHATAEETEKFIYEEIICRHGCPQIILSDRGTHFNNQLIKGLMERFQIKHLLSTPYHPQTNGLVERFNRTLCESLAKLITQSNEWDNLIPPVLFAYRTSKQSTTKVPPFYLTYGRNATLPMDQPPQNKEDPPDRLTQLLDKLPQDRTLIKNRIDQQQIKQKEYHDQHITKPVEFKIGDKVLLYRAEKEKHYSGKFDEKWKGPYYIHAVLPHGSYKLRDLSGKVLKTPFNGKILKLYYNRQEWNPQIVIS